MKQRKQQQDRIRDVGHGSIDEDCLPLIVPRFDRPLAPPASVRLRALRRHLVEALRAPKPAAASEPPTPAVLADFPARVARAACTLCQGWCCRNGGEHAYLDERTLARVCQARPGLDARAVLRLYTARVPKSGYEASCIFHGRQGCTLDQTLRSDVCNQYFCGGLEGYLAAGETNEPVVVIAGDGERMRISPAIMP